MKKFRRLAVFTLVAAACASKPEPDAGRFVSFAPELPAVHAVLPGQSGAAEASKDFAERPDSTVTPRFHAIIESAADAVLETGGARVLESEAPTLQVLHDRGGRVWLRARDPRRGFKVTLRTQAEFRAWLEGAEAGKIRIIQRGDGLEVQTDLGKVPGPDRHGPTISDRNGGVNATALRAVLHGLRKRFPHARDFCLAPSFGTELRRIADALEANFTSERQPIFDEMCLVFPSRSPVDL